MCTGNRVMYTGKLHNVRLLILAAAAAAAAAGAAAVVVHSSPTTNMGDGKEDYAFDHAVEEFSELCRRNKRARQAAQTALLPPDLVQAVLVQ